VTVDLSVFNAPAYHDEGIFMPRRLSYSSISTYAECGEKYRLEKLHKVGTGTWWATIAGKAVHYITELRDRIEILGEVPWDEVTDGYINVNDQPSPLPTFRQAFDYFLAKEGHEGQEIKASGRKGLNDYSFLGGPSGRDQEWWYRFGPQYVDAWVAWRDQVIDAGWQLLEVEVDFEVELGGYRVIGSIDRVFFIPETGQIIIVDLKTGANEPSDSIQLVTYREGLRKSLFVDADQGNYVFFRWVDGEKPELPEKPAGRRPGKVQLEKAQSADEAGQPSAEQLEILERQRAFEAWDEAVQAASTTPLEPGRVEAFANYGTDLAAYPTEFVERVYQQARVGIENQVFPFNTSDNCERRCGVFEFCRAVGGRRAGEYPIFETIKWRSDDDTSVSPTANSGDASSVSSSIPEEGK